MTDHPSPIDLAPNAKLVTRVYSDLAAGATRQVGDRLEDAVRVALRPVDGVLWTIDRTFDWLADRVVARFRSLGRPAEGIIPPPPLLQARAIQALQVLGPADDPLLRNYFAALVARAMDGKGVRKRSAILNTLHLLEPDDARLLAIVAASGRALHTANVRVSWSLSGDAEAPFENRHEEVFTDAHRCLEGVLNLERDELDEAISHLVRLGILVEPTVNQVHLDPADLHFTTLPSAAPCDALFVTWAERCASIRKAGPSVRAPHEFLRNETFGHWIGPTPWGRQVVDACAASEFFDSPTSTFRLPAWAA